VHGFVHFSGNFLNEKKSIGKGGRVNITLHERLRVNACGGVSSNATGKSAGGIAKKVRPVDNVIFGRQQRGGVMGCISTSPVMGAARFAGGFERHRGSD
jgi:hypothetical protein